MLYKKIDGYRTNFCSKAKNNIDVQSSQKDRKKKKIKNKEKKQKKQQTQVKPMSIPKIPEERKDKKGRYDSSKSCTRSEMTSR